MGFTAKLLGLPDKKPTGVFEECREDDQGTKCPHKGTDFSSNGKLLPFKAGIWGVVSEPWASDGGTWGSVTVRDMKAPESVIQFLHCSKVDVKLGDLVAPWTQLGVTGKKNTKDVHLHVHVIKDTNESQHKCWWTKPPNSYPRNFVNPETWDTSDCMQGDWFTTRVHPPWKGSLGGDATYEFVVTETRHLHIGSTSNNYLRLVSNAEIDGLGSCRKKVTWNFAYSRERNCIKSRSMYRPRSWEAAGCCACRAFTTFTRGEEFEITLNNKDELQVTDIDSGLINLYTRVSPVLLLDDSLPLSNDTFDDFKSTGGNSFSYPVSFFQKEFPRT